MDRTPQDFYNRTVGNAYDIDGAYGYQCWDGMAKFCVDNGIPLSVIHCAQTGYVKDIWNLRKTSGILQYFDEIQSNQIETGDWVIWGDIPLAPKSHVAMAWYGNAYGQSQSGIKAFNVVDYLPLSSALGAFRWKGWTNDMRINAGQRFETLFNNQRIIVYGQPLKDKLTLISAKTDGHVTGRSVQLIDKIDDTTHIYDAKINANYFIMKDGTSLGIRCGVNEWSVPRQGAFYYYAVHLDGHTEIGMDTDFWYQKGQIQFACSPAIILMMNGNDVWLESPACKGSKDYPNTQSMLLRTNERFAFAMCTGKLSAKQCLEWAKTIEGIQDVILMDSGGSSCMQIGYDVIYSTGEHRKIPNALAFYKDKVAIPSEPIVSTPQEPITEPIQSDTEPIEQPVEDDIIVDNPLSETGSNEVETPMNNKDDYLFKMSNRMYDLLKFITHIIPILLTFYVAISKVWNLPLTDSIVATVTAFDSMLITIMNMSTIGYRNKGGD